MAQQFHEHKMDVIKMDLLTRNKRKSVYADGDLLVFSVMEQLLGNICICSDDETRDNEMVKLVYQWTMATSDVFVLKSILI
jgi:hypothetical protein